jgi:glycerol uptake facilitator
MASEFTSRRGLGGELLAEFLGTMVLILFGDGVVAVVLLFLGFSLGPSGATSSWLLINWGWGFAVMLGVYVAGAISGAHLNPAVTLGFALRGITPWNKVGWYMLFQFLGAWFAALILFIEYQTGFTSLEAKDGIVRGSPQSAGMASVFFTNPHTTLGGQVVPIWNAFFDQVLGTFLLVYLILAIVDARSTPPLSNLARTPDTPSTPRVTSARACSPGWRDGERSPFRAMAQDIPPTSGSRLSGHWLAARSPRSSTSSH